MFRECCVCSNCICCLRSSRFLCRLLYICGPSPYGKRMNHAGMLRHPEGDETSTQPSTRAIWMEKGEKWTRNACWCSSDRWCERLHAQLLKFPCLWHTTRCSPASACVLAGGKQHPLPAAATKVPTQTLYAYLVSFPITSSYRFECAWLMLSRLGPN